MPAWVNRDKVKAGKWEKPVVYHSALGQILTPPGKAGVLWSTMKGRWAPPEKTVTLLGASPTRPWQCSWWQRDAVCLQDTLNPWKKRSSSLHAPVFPDLLSVPSCKAALCSMHVRDGEYSCLAWVLCKWLIYYNIEAERKKDSETQPAWTSEPSQVQKGRKAQIA